MSELLEWEVKDFNLSDIHEYGASSREYTITDLENIKKSIKKFGLIEPLVVNTNGVIIDGHLRYNALLELGKKKVKCTYPSRELSDEEHAEAYLRKNRNIAGVDNYAILRTHFTIEELQDGGFNEEEIEHIFQEEQDIVVDEKPEVFNYEMVFDSEEEKNTAISLLEDLNGGTLEGMEDILIGVIKKEQADEQ